MKYLSSGELAGLCGVSKDLLRHYERVGVISPPERTDSGYRVYAASAVQEVKAVRRALQLGFSLRELADMRALRASGQAPCRDVRRLAAKRLESIEVQMQELEQLKADLTSLVQDWDERLLRVEVGQPAHLLDRLAGADYH